MEKLHRKYPLQWKVASYDEMIFLGRKRENPAFLLDVVSVDILN